MNIPSFAWPIIAVGLALVSVGADSILKLSTESTGKNLIIFFILGLIIYGSTAFGWFFVIKHIDLSTLGVYYSVSTVLFLALVGVFYFKEQINTPEIIGIALAVTSILLLGRFT
jgi:small multidrug resistance pump